MCLAVPARLISCSHSEAFADLHGTRVRISTMLVPDVLPGDWVLIHAGFAIQRLEPQEVVEVWANTEQLRHRPPDLFDPHRAAASPGGPTGECL